MKSLETRVLATLLRVRQFGLTHADGFPDGSRGRELFALVETIIEDIRSHSAAQTLQAHAAKEKTTQKNAALDAMREGMEAIARTARAMSPGAPGLQDKFRLPTNSREENWLAAARAFATEAEPLKAEFIKRGMAVNFLEDFRARIAAFEQSVDGRAQKEAARVSATAAVARAANRGREALRELDAVVLNVFGADQAALAEWESASRVERAPRRADNEAPAAESEAPAAAT